jgi:hypothetical protein
LRNILHQESKTKTKQNVGAGRTTGATTTNEQRHIPGAMARGVGFLQALQDDVHLLWDVIGCVRLSGDFRDWGQAKVHQNLGHVPHQGRWPLNLEDAFHLGVLKKPPELNELH